MLQFDLNCVLTIFFHYGKKENVFSLITILRISELQDYYFLYLTIQKIIFLDGLLCPDKVDKGIVLDLSSVDTC